MGQNLSKHVSAWYINTIDTCENNSTKIYSKISGATSCRYIGITGCLRHYPKNFTPVYNKDFGYLVKSGGKGALESRMECALSPSHSLSLCPLIPTRVD